jgi:excisionase family DNA binding protein
VCSPDSFIGTEDSCLLLTIDEAARLLRISRSRAYAMAHEYLNSGGTSGLPVIRFGTSMRVPRWALIELALTGRVVRLCDADLRRSDERVDH